jgi:hypothetical protein
MHNDIAVIEQHPMAVIKSLYPQKLSPSAPDLLLYGLGNRLHLRGTFPRADDKIIGNYGESAEIQNDRVNSLLAQRRLRRPEGQVFTF